MWYIGQEVTNVLPMPRHGYPAGSLFRIRSLKTCRCGLLHIDVGLTCYQGGYYACKCTTYGHRLAKRYCYGPENGFRPVIDPLEALDLMECEADTTPVRIEEHELQLA